MARRFRSFHHGFRRAAGHAVLAALLLFAQAVAGAHRIEHADHDTPLPAGHNCVAFDAVLGASAPPPAIVATLEAPVLPRPVASVAVAPAPDLREPRAAFRPRDPPTSLPN